MNYNLIVCIHKFSATDITDFIKLIYFLHLSTKLTYDFEYI